MKPPRPYVLTGKYNRERARTGIAKLQMSMDALLFFAQAARCFHCQGHLHIYGTHPDSWLSAAKVTFDHALPKALRRETESRIGGAGFHAHALCNNERRDRLLTPLEWASAQVIWARALRLCTPLPPTIAHQLTVWIDYAQGKLEEKSHDALDTAPAHAPAQ